MKKTKLTTLLNKIEKEVGSKYVYWDDYGSDETMTIQVGDWAEDDVREIIEDAGYEIIDDSWFSGSDFDGIVFEIKK